MPERADTAASLQHLAQPKVLARAAVAGLLTTLACLSALITAPSHPYPSSFEVPIFFCCVSLLWAFVFAWHFQYTTRPVFLAPFKPKFWLEASAYAVIVGVLEYRLLDPPLRQLMPGEFPSDTTSWLAMCAFQVLFVPLFTCLAPYAFFMRLLQRPAAAMSLTVLWGVVIAYARLSSVPTLPALTVTAMIFLTRVVGGFAAVYFYLNGSVWLIWWIALLLQLRLWLEITVARSG